MAQTQRSEKSTAVRRKVNGVARSLTVRPDGLDFRDKMYVPTLVEVPATLELDIYRSVAVPILDQGQEGACTGFGLSTVAHYLLRKRRPKPDPSLVSPHMLYDLARRYDEWGGEAYEGSSCRGAIKGWFKHGVCADTLWKRSGKRGQVLSEPVEADAANRPLGAYFRVNHKDLIAMHAAISEVGVLYASASVHAGWDKVGKDGRIPFSETVLGGHAFAIVAYDREGFWIQNSWGANWGYHGFCHIGYDDWLANGTDVWVARLGVPIVLPKAAGKPDRRAVLAATTGNFSLSELRPHVVSIGNDGCLNSQGDIGTSAEAVREILSNDFERITAGWKKKRLVLYAHGGLVSQADALQMVNEMRKPMLDAECYPLAFIWKTDFWTTLTNMLTDATRRRRPEGVLDNLKDFMLDRLDDALEPLARVLTGKASWDEMKENALLATAAADGGARLVAELVAGLVLEKGVELHIVGHSAGSIFHAPLLQYLTSDGDIRSGPLATAKLKGLGVPVTTCTLWAPACTVQLFKQTYLPSIQAGKVGQFGLFTLTDKAEQDDNCAHLYNKSLLYLVAHAFEQNVRIPRIRPDGEAILGMSLFVNADAELQALFKSKKAGTDWVTAPNNEPLGSRNATTARHHGDFDNDTATVQATLARILDKKNVAVTPSSSVSVLSHQTRRGFIANASR
jgi:hypothetical protein